MGEPKAPRWLLPEVACQAQRLKAMDKMVFHRLGYCRTVAQQGVDDERRLGGLMASNQFRRVSDDLAGFADASSGRIEFRVSKTASENSENSLDLSESRLNIRISIQRHHWQMMLRCKKSHIRSKGQGTWNPKHCKELCEVLRSFYDTVFQRTWKSHLSDLLAMPLKLTPCMCLVAFFSDLIAITTVDFLVLFLVLFPRLLDVRLVAFGQCIFVIVASVLNVFAVGA
jgi:hypothetical protein